MIRMGVRTNHPQDWLAFQARGKNRFPVLTNRVASNAAVNQGPARAPLYLVLQQIQIDMVQSKRQGHAQPANAWRHL